MGAVALFGILALIPIIIVVAIILLATRKSEESFQKRMNTIYNYIVSLIALVMLIVGIVLLITSITDLLLPTQTTMYLRDIHEIYISIIGSIGIIIAGIPLFIFHQKNIHRK